MSIFVYGVAKNFIVRKINLEFIALITVADLLRQEKMEELGNMDTKLIENGELSLIPTLKNMLRLEMDSLVFRVERSTNDLMYIIKMETHITMTQII